MALKGFGSPEATRLYLQAYDLCGKLPEEAWHFPIYWGWWRVSPDFHAQRERSQTLLRRARVRGDPEFILQAHHCNWASHYHAGDFIRCSDHLNAGLLIYHQGDYRHHASLYGNHDAKVCGHGLTAQALWMQGRARSALEEERQSLVWAESLDHLGSRVHAMDFSLLHRVYRRDYQHVFRKGEELIAFTSEAGLVDQRSKGLIFRGWTAAAQGDVQAGLADLQEGLARQYEIGTIEDFPVYLCMLAEALIAAGRPDKAIEELHRARIKFDAVGLCVWMPEVLRTLAEAVLAADPSSIAEAEQLLTKAGAVARHQGAAMLVLRVAMCEARLDLRLDRTECTAARLGAALEAIPEREGAEVEEAAVLLSQLPDTSLAWLRGTE
jgi:predicted ATPase